MTLYCQNDEITLIEHDLYNQLCHKHLDNTINFKRLEWNTLDDVIIHINKTLICLVDTNYISKRLFNSLYLKNCKEGSFRILAKLH